MPFLRKYGVLTVTGTTAIRVPIVKRGVVDFAVSADYTPAAGDVKILVDGTAAANVTNLPTAIAAGANTGTVWEFVLTAAELTGKQMQVVISDAATKAIEDQSFIVETYGNASAMYVTDFSAALATSAQAVALQADTDDIQTRIPAALTANGNMKSSMVEILTTALTETAGLLAGGFKKFFNIATPAATMDHGVLVDTVTTYTGNTPQTGDAYGVVNDGTFGNAHLVRSSTPANALDVSATGEAGLDFSNIKQATGATTLTNIRVPNVTLTDTATALTGYTAPDNTSITAIKAKTDILPAAAAFLESSVNDTGATTTLFKGANGLSSTDSFYVNSVVAFTSGTLKGLARKVSAYTGSTRQFTFATALPSAPTNGDTFQIIGDIE